MAEFNDPERYKVIAGDAWAHEVHFGEGDPNDDENWTPEDLSGLGDWSSHWRIDTESTEKIVLTVDATDAATGIIRLSATEEQTRAMGDDGVFDIQAATPRVRTPYAGKTKWELDVTRD